MASKKSITNLEVTLIGGPVDSKKMNLCYPLPKYIMMGMGRYCYEKINSLEFHYTEDKEKIALLMSENPLTYDATKNTNS